MTVLYNSRIFEGRGGYVRQPPLPKMLLLYTLGNSTVNRKFTDFKIFEVQKKRTPRRVPNLEGVGLGLGPRSFLGPRASPVPSPCGGRLRALKRTARAGRGSPGRVPSRLRARPRPILVSALASFSRGLACARPSPPSSPAPRAAPWAPGCRAPRAVPWPPCGGAWALSRGSRLPGLSGLGPLGCGPFRAPRGPRALFWGGGLAAGGSACGPGFGLGGFRWLCVPGLRSVPPPRPLPRRLRRVPGCVGRGRGFWRSRAALPRWAGSVHRPPHSIVTKGGR